MAQLDGGLDLRGFSFTQAMLSTNLIKNGTVQAARAAVRFQPDP